MCLNDGQCYQNESSDIGDASCVCPPGYAGTDCSDLRVLDAVNLPGRSFVANAGEAANMALLAVSGSSR